MTYGLATAYQHPGSAVFAARTGSWVIAMYLMTLATNLTATGELALRFGSCLSDCASAVLLAVRLWTVNHKAKTPKEESRLYIVFRVVVETGVIYTVVNVVTLVTFMNGSPAAYIIRDLVRAYSVPYFNPSLHARSHRVHL